MKTSAKVVRSKMPALMIALEGSSEPINATDLCKKLQITRTSLYGLIGRNRRNFTRGVTDKRIWTTVEGYTLNPNKDGVVYESTTRASSISGMVCNSIPVFKACRHVSPVDYLKQSRQIAGAFKLIKVERIESK